jgi:hypothetical protein
MANFDELWNMRSPHTAVRHCEFYETGAVKAMFPQWHQ